MYCLVLTCLQGDIVMASPNFSHVLPLVFKLVLIPYPP
jgi:hypothetical protein